jgi:hypothetical protein
MDPSVFTHEIGHHLGLPDEYVQLGSADRATLTSAGVRLDASLMGEARMTWSDGQAIRDHSGP